MKKHYMLPPKTLGLFQLRAAFNITRFLHARRDDYSGFLPLEQRGYCIISVVINF